MARTEDARETDSGIEIEPVYGDGGQPGEFPTTRPLPGHVPRAAVDDPAVRWLRLGGGRTRASRYLLERGQTGLSVAFDLPTQLGYDSDDPHAVGEVGRTGVAIDSIEDMRLLLDRIRSARSRPR